jgi:fructose 1,6-bisphosphate aldolase/phosphatase
MGRGVIKADVGGFVGHGAVYPAVVQLARDELVKAVGQKLLIDGPGKVS